MPSQSVSPKILALVEPWQWESLYDDVLVHSFPAVELDSRDTLLEMLRTGNLRAYGIIDDEPVSGENPRVVAGVMTAVHNEVELILYLAIAAAARAGGLGSALLAHAVNAGASDPAVKFVLAEIEHPDHHTASEAYGDPTARMRFYVRNGARFLTVPYFQPALGPGEERVPALVLAIVWASDDRCRFDDAGDPTSPRVQITAAPIAEFLRTLLTQSEGSIGTDPATVALLDSVSGEWVDVVTDLALVPAGILDAHSTHAPR